VAGEGEGGRGETVLVVDDEPAVRELARAVLERAGYTVLTAGDGEEALRVVAGHPGAIHLLLTDVVMPGMNGRQLAEALQAVRPALRVLYVSGYTEDALLRRGVRAELDHFLQKPYASAVLIQKVREVLEAPAG
jgi:two-component system cell cycle sensor histidine kinase/response regulator CckA